jgi:hypothetical protein
MANTPFPIPAHQTERADLRHSAFRLVSPWVVGHTGSDLTARGFGTVHHTILRPAIQQSRTAPVFDGVLRLVANHHDLSVFESAPEVRVLSSTGITQLQRSYDPVRLPPEPPPVATLRPLPSPTTGLPRLPKPPFRRACSLPRRIKRVRMSIASPLMQPSPNGRRVGIRIVTFEACSGFTRVTARRIAQSPKATFVTRLQPCQLPNRAARQLPDQSTIIWVESSSTDGSRLRGARPGADMQISDERNTHLRSRPLDLRE